MPFLRLCAFPVERNRRRIENFEELLFVKAILFFRFILFQHEDIGAKVEIQIGLLEYSAQVLLHRPSVFEESQLKQSLAGALDIRNRAIADVAFSFAEITEDFAFLVCSSLRSR